MSDKPKIGWIGLGKMGIPMSANLVKKGYSVTVWNRSKEKAKACVDAGAKVADTIKQLAADSDVIISMIADDAALAAVSAEAFSGAKAGATFIDMSTVSPTLSASVDAAAKAKGIKYLRAPVSGSTVLATAGTLTIFASGPKDAFDACEPIFQCMGQKVFYVGATEEARYAKLVMNIMVGLTSAMVAEALAFGEKGGMDWKQMIDLVSASVAASPLFNYKAAILKDKNFAPAFTASQMAKDFGLAMGAAQDMNQPMPLVSLVRQYYGSMMATGNGEKDFFGLVELWESMGGVK